MRVEISRRFSVNGIRLWKTFLALLITAGLAVAAGAAAQDHDPNATLNLATNADPTLNPWTPGAVIESNLINTILFEQLTRYSPEDLSPAPALAVSWEAADDAMSWTFKLREGVLWSDGTPFTADDVAFTFNDVVLVDELGAQSATQFAQVDHVEVVDPLTVRFVLNSPFSALPYYLASFSGILPAHVLGDAENPLTVASFNKQNPVTTGPYRVAEFVPGSYVRLVPNEHYWGEDPKLAGIVFRIIPDANTQVAQLMAGQLDLVTRLNPSLLAGVENNPNLEVLRQSQNLYFWVALNQHDERFTDVRVRQALLMALDREAMIAALIQGYGTVATGPIAPLLGAIYNPDVPSYPYDPEGAQALLAEAGWTPGPDGILQKDGQRMQIAMPTGQFGELVPATLLVQQYWADIGVEADVNVIEWNAYIQEVVVRRQYEATLAWWSQPPTPDVTPYYSCEAVDSGNNIPNYCSEELDQLLAAGRRALTTEEQIAAYADVQQYLAEELPYLYLYYPDILSVKNTRLQGFPEINASTAFQHAAQWYMTR
jgi:peptide/nickel transport system substrate-binding protein